jgi:DNA-directed RNA polymerase specialized sigma24 family protein
VTPRRRRLRPGNFTKEDPVGGAGEIYLGEADAAEEVFKGVYPRLAGWVRRLVDDDTAHEAASEAFVRAPSQLGG